MTADVVVVTWNARAALTSCLEHLRRQTRPCTVIVVDNGSTDGTAEHLRTGFADVRVVALDRNRGFGGGVAAGVAAGDGEAIVLVNDDADVEPGFVEAIVRPLEDDPGTGMVAGLLAMPGSGLVDGFGIELDVTLAAYNRLRRRPPSERPGVLAMPSGGAAAYRRSAFEAAEGFDPALFAYGEDVDLGLRLRAAGWRVAEAPGARGVHVGAATVGVDSPLQRLLAGFARGFLLRRYGILRSRAAARALLVEALVVGWGIARHGTTIPLRARVAGWRAAGRRRVAVDPTALDRSITLAETLRRLRAAR